MVLAALSWAVFAVLSTLVMRPFGAPFGQLAGGNRLRRDLWPHRLLGSLGAFLEGIWSKVHQAGCRHASCRC